MDNINNEEYRDTETHSKLKELSLFLTNYATYLMAVGVHTSRVVLNTERIANSLGVTADMIIFQKTIILTLRNKESNHSYSTLDKIKPLAPNFDYNSRLSALSWEAYDHKLSIEELKTKFDAIICRPRMNRWIVLFLVACANASFCHLFTGDWKSMVVVFFATLIGFFIRQYLVIKELNHLFIFVISSFVASMIGGIAVLFHIGNTPEIALGTSVLYLTPGVPLLNGVIDIIEGHVLAGFSHLMNAALSIICIAIGLSITLLLLGVNSL